MHRRAGPAASLAGTAKALAQRGLRYGNGACGSRSSSRPVWGRPHRQMFHPGWRKPVRRETALLPGHRRLPSRASCSNSRRHTKVSSGGSAGHTCPDEVVHPGSGRRGWPAMALRETYTVMPPPPGTMSGGLAGGRASPPPHHGGWEQTADHPPTQPSWRYASGESLETVRSRTGRASGPSRGVVRRSSIPPSAAPCQSSRHRHRHTPVIWGELNVGAARAEDRENRYRVRQASAGRVMVCEG